MLNKPKVMITFREGGENGGPFVSHKRIIESKLKNKYEFVPLIIPKGKIGVFNIKLLKKLVEEINEYKPDIIHFTGLQLEGFHVALAAKISGVNTVLVIRGSSLEAIEFVWWKKQILNILEIVTLKLSDVCYGVSEYVCMWKRVKKYANYCYGHIYNMPGEKTYIDYQSKSFREEINVKKDDILIVSTGRITREKGFGVLLNVIKNMKIPVNVKFIIAGEGHYLDTMKKEIKKYELEEKVLILGYRNDIDRILSESDIFVICTLHETLCNSIIEAGYHALPSIATNVGGIPEIINDEHNGFLVDVYDYRDIIKKINILISNTKKRKQMGKNAKEIIDTKFSKKKIVKQIDDLYRSVLLNEK